MYLVHVCVVGVSGSGAASEDGREEGMEGDAAEAGERQEKSKPRSQSAVLLLIII